MNATGIHRCMRDAKAKCIAEGSIDMHDAPIANGRLHGRPALLAQPAVELAA